MKFSMEKRKVMYGYVFILPFIIGIIVFFAFPLILSLALSFGKIDKIVGIKVTLTGFENYVRAFVIDPSFLPTLWKVAKQVAIRVPLIIVFSMVISILINKDIKFKGFFRTVFFLPFLLGTGHVMNQLLGQDIANDTLATARGIIVPPEVMAYLGSSVGNAIDAILNEITLVLWKTGVQVLLFLSGLQTIPVSLYESARIDSATEWEMFWKITLPMMSPMLLLNIIYTIIDSFTDMSNPILSYIQNTSFKQFKYEYAAAMGWIYFVLIIIIISIVFYALRNYVYDTSYERKVGKKWRQE